MVGDIEVDEAAPNAGVESPAAGEPSGSGASDEGKAQKTPKRHPKLRALLAGAGPTPRRMRWFLSRNSFPLVERDAVTFVFDGGAEAVYLHHFMRGVPGGLPFEKIPDTTLWHLRLPVPTGSRFEYKFDVVQNGAGTWINDPLNPFHATDPFGANSVGTSYGYVPPDWTEHHPEVPAGRIETMAIESQSFGETREIGIYLPASFSEDRNYPVVVLHDGTDFLQHAGLKTVLDNLIAHKDVPPFLAVLTRPGERNGEYTGDTRHADFLVNEVLPLVRERFPVLPEPQNLVLLGSSLGAVASLATAFRHPGTFGALALMSGSFILDRKLLENRDPLFGRVADLVDLVRADPARLPKRIFVGCGMYEGLFEQNRMLAGLLEAQGVDVWFMETRDAHHWQNWRDQLKAALSWTLPPQA